VAVDCESEAPAGIARQNRYDWRVYTERTVHSLEECCDWNQSHCSL